MASLQAFLSVLDEFIQELVETFPEEKKIKVYQNAYQTMKKANPRKVLESFMDAAMPLSEYITNKDEKILELNNELLNELNIKKWWTPELSKNTKDAIWQYLNTLYILGTTINSIPQNLLSSIEQMAEKCASEMSDTSDGKMPDMSQLMAGMQNIIQKK